MLHSTTECKGGCDDGTDVSTIASADLSTRSVRVVVVVPGGRDDRSLRFRVVTAVVCRCRGTRDSRSEEEDREEAFLEGVDDEKRRNDRAPPLPCCSRSSMDSEVGGGPYPPGGSKDGGSGLL